MLRKKRNRVSRAKNRAPQDLPDVPIVRDLRERGLALTLLDVGHGALHASIKSSSRMGAIFAAFPVICLPRPGASTLSERAGPSSEA